MQGKYNGNEVDDSMINGCSQMCQHKQDRWSRWFLLKYFDMYIQQRFVATEMEEFEVVSNTLCTTFM